MDTATPDLDPTTTAPGAPAGSRWRGARGWAVSSGIHLMLLLMLTYALTATRPHEEDLVPRLATKFIPPTVPPVTPPDRTKIPPTPADTQAIEQVSEVTLTPSDTELASLTPDTETPTPVETPTEVPAETPSTEATSTAFSTMPAAIGAGPGGGRPSGIGTRGSKNIGVGIGHPKPARLTVKAVDASLRWFARHQDADGGWKVLTYPNQCQGSGPRCEPGKEHTGRDGDVACTALALLCYLGYGHDGVTPTTHRKVVARGLTWLAAQQGPDGTFGDRNYEHAVAVMALCDAIAVAGGRLDKLKPAVQRGVDVILARQNPGPADSKLPSGWDYARPNAHRDDSSVTGWNVMALKSAHIAGLKVGQGLAGSKVWLERSWNGANPRRATFSTGDESVFPYVCDPTTGTTEREHLSGLGAACAAFLGFKRGEVLLESLANRIVAKDLPRLQRWPCNTYQLYYDCMAMFQITSDNHGGDPRWTAWNQPVTDMLIGGQRQDEDCFSGSWDYTGTEFPGHDTGRLLSTALCCLSLETQERFQVATKPN